MEEITSVNNELVKETAKLQQKKYRDLTNQFLLEGYKSIEEAVKAGVNIEYVFANSKALNKYDFCNCRIISTNEAILKKIASTESAPESIAVAKQIHNSIDELKNANRIILLEGIKDLGNLGTIIRTSSALGADGIILYGDCADLYNPKCVRSTVGNLWKTPIAVVKDIKVLEKHFANYKRIATLPLSDNLLKNFKPSEKMLIMFGSEADGLSKELINFSTDSLKIEMKGDVESLNLAVSCAVVMYTVM